MCIRVSSDQLVELNRIDSEGKGSTGNLLLGLACWLGICLHVCVGRGCIVGVHLPVAIKMLFAAAKKGEDKGEHL